MEHMSGANCIAVHHGDYWLGDGANLLLHIEHVEAGHAILANVTSLTLHVLVTTGTKGLVTCSGEYHHAHFLHLAADAQCVAHLCGGSGGKGVAVARAVNGDACDTVVKIKQDILIFPDGSPFSLCHILNFLSCS